MAEIVIKIGKRGKTRIPEDTLKEMRIEENDYILIEIKHKATWREMLTPESLKELNNPNGGDV